jgi:hypothetical protein
MELIQNADDNKYANSVAPTLSIGVSPEYVKVECNEEGFTQQNVQAICRTGKSSKPAGDGYTGEKGIGFKSVFKIAKRAHIRSNEFYFELDQDRVLGMVTPQWDKSYFAKHPNKYQTTIVLDGICEPSKNSNFAVVLEKDIKAIHPIVILFLRRIKRLHLRLQLSSSSQGSTISKRFRCDEGTLHPQISSLEDEDSGIIEFFYKSEHVSKFTGIEARRPHKQTKVTLAFPVKRHSSSSWMPQPRQLPTFAYLPLGNFGFNVSYLSRMQFERGLPLSSSSFKLTFLQLPAGRL